MLEAYPFPVPQSSLIALEKNHLGEDCRETWKDYAPNWSPEQAQEPLALVCLGLWIGFAERALSVLHEMCARAVENGDSTKHTNGAPLDLISSYALFLLHELKDVHSMAQRTLPFDPVIHRMFKKGSEQERNLQ